MFQYAIKLVLSAGIIVLVSEVARRNALLGGLIASLPLTSLLAIVWIHAETRDTEAVAALCRSIFWLVIPSLLFFILLPLLLKKQIPFYIALLITGLGTGGAYWLMLKLLERLAIRL